MILNFLVPTNPFPVGGTMAMIEFANGMARRGHETHLTHVEFVGRRPSSIDELSWCELDPRHIHHFPEHHPSDTAVCGTQFDDDDLPSADFVFCFDDRIPTGRGLPLMWVQAYGILGRLEPMIYTAPCPKLCVSRWLVDVVADHGAPVAQGFHLPYGLRHEKYRLTRPIAGRRRRISMLYNSHPTKGANFGLEAIAQVLERVPDADAVLFGTTPLVHAIPDRVTYVNDPEQSRLVDEIYNTSRVFISSSPYEGFGLAAIEAMACGCALVTAANGGSADYAIHDETALVSPPRDADSIARHAEALLLDDGRCEDVASAGLASVGRFDWDVSAERLEGFLHAYGADPATYTAAASAPHAAPAP